MQSHFRRKNGPWQPRKRAHHNQKGSQKSIKKTITKNIALASSIPTIIGSFFILGHFLIIGFTPDLTLGQASLILVQSFLVGSAFVIALSASILMPALVYRVAEVEQRLNLAQALPRMRGRIFVRSTLSNLFGVGSLVGFAFFTGGTTSADRWLASFLIEIALLALIFLFFLPHLEAEEKTETRIEYFQTILLSAIGSWLSVPIFAIVFLGIPKAERPDDLYLIAGWIITSIGSALIAALPNLPLHVRGILSIGVLLLTLNVIGALRTPFQAVANVLGISPSGNVTLLMGKNACHLIARTYNSTSCDANGGALSDVTLLNTLGNRWLISLDNKKSSIAIPAEGLAYRITSKAKHDSSAAQKK